MKIKLKIQFLINQHFVKKRKSSILFSQNSLAKGSDTIYHGNGIDSNHRKWFKKVFDFLSHKKFFLITDNWILPQIHSFCWRRNNFRGSKSIRHKKCKATVPWAFYRTFGIGLDKIVETMHHIRKQASIILALEIFRYSIAKFLQLATVKFFSNFSHDSPNVGLIPKILHCKSFDRNDLNPKKKEKERKEKKKIAEKFFRSSKLKAGIQIQTKISKAELANFEIPWLH